MDENEFVDNNNAIFKVEDKISKKSMINNLIIQLDNAISEDSYDNIIKFLKLCILYTKNYPIPINPTVISYNFIPNIVHLYFSSYEDKSKLAIKLLLKISFHQKSEIMQYFIENNFFEAILNKIFTIQDQNIIHKSLKFIINVISDFSQAINVIYLYPDIIETFFQVIIANEILHENIEKIIVILSIISEAEINFEQKKPIFYESISLLSDESYQQFWPLILSIPASMIINNEISKFMFTETKLLQICQSYLRCNDEILLEATIRCIGRYFLFESKYICIDYWKIMKCAESTNSKLSYASLWLLSNALACNSEMISTIESSGDIYRLLRSFFSNDSIIKCKLEACRAMQSIIKQGRKDQIENAIRSDFIFGFIQVVEIENSSNEMKLAEDIIKTIDFLLNVKVFQMKDSKLKKICKKQFSQAGGYEAFENLLDCEFDNVARAAQNFLDKMQENYK